MNPSANEPLFSRRINVSLTGGGVRIKASWPFGRIDLDREAMTLSTAMTSYRIPHSDIESLGVGWFDVAINHRAPGVPANVRLRGWGLKQALRHAIAMESLPLKFNG